MKHWFAGTMMLGEGTISYDAEAEVSERQPWEHITGGLQDEGASDVWAC